MKANKTCHPNPTALVGNCLTGRMREVNPKVIIPLAVFCIALHFLDRDYLEPRKEAKTQVVQNLNASLIHEIVIEPTGDLGRISGIHRITEPKSIAAICELISDAGVHRPTRPNAEWQCNLKILTTANTWEIEIHDTKNDGTLAYAEVS